MDHFNITIQNGALVSTRRGLQVTKHKYHGTSFVNTSGPAQPSGASVGTSGRKRAPSRAAAANKSTSTAASTPASTPAPSGFSSFSVAAPTPAGDRAEAEGQTSQNSQTSRKSRPKAAETSKSADPAKPLVHRWKLVTKPATKAKRDSSSAASSAASSTVAQKPPKTPTPTQDHLSVAAPAAPPPPAAWTPATTFSDTATPLPSPLLATPPPSAPGSSPDSHTSASSSSSSSSLSPQTPWTLTSPPLSPLESLLTSPAEWEAEHVSPPSSTDALQRRSTATSAGSKARRARVQALINSYQYQYQQIDRSLPTTWTMGHVPQLTAFEQRVFHQFFQLIPRKLYPFEDLLQYNPARSSEFYWMVVQDRAAVRCVLLCGAMFRAMLSGANNSDELAMEVSNVCRVVNQQLARHHQQQQHQQHQQKQHQLTAPKRRVIPDMTLECITTLALMGGSTGRYDHWHLHMQALRKMVQLNGGSVYLADDVRPALLFKMRKTDLKGAMALALRPYLPCTARKFPDIADAVLLDVTRRDIAAAASAVFAATDDPVAGIAPAVGRTLGELCVFVQAVQLCADLAKTATPLPLDPYGFSEGLYWLQYHLVAQPGPLRQAEEEATEATTTAPTAHAKAMLPVDTSHLETESYVRNHRAPLAAPYIVPAALAPGSTDLEPAMRICAILYLKEYFPDFPHNLGGYAILLHLLRHHLGRVLDHAPLLLHSRSARAMLLWMCLMGDTVSRLANGNEQRHSKAEQYDRRVFRDRLVDLIGTAAEVGGGHTDDTDNKNGATTPGVDGLLSSDWAVCRLLDLGKLPHQGPWSDRQGVLNILLEAEI